MTGERVRLVHCAETITGGIATYLRELILIQRETLGPGAITVVVPLSQIGELPLPDGVEMVVFDDSCGRTGRAIRVAFHVAQVVRARRPDVVHIHSTFAGAAVRLMLAALSRSTRVIYCPHGWAFDRPLSLLWRTGVCGVERLLSVFTYVIVCVSEHERRAAIANGISPEKLRVVLNGVSSERPESIGKSPSWPAGKIRVLFAGRFDRQKGVDILASAMSELVDEAHAVFAGGSVLQDEDELKLPSNVTTVGWLTPNELEAFFDAADVLVVPSRWEGFGLIAAEAMRAGLPVIASRVGGLPEVVEDTVTGILVEPESPESIVIAIRGLGLQRGRRMGVAGRQRVLDRFSMARVHRELSQIYGFSS